MSKPFLPTYLYIKTHNKTGLKYFGKTTNDPYAYYGSGIYWLSHLRKHGFDITTKVIGYYTDKDECINAATKFSIENNIVNEVDHNHNKVWANLILENGLDGGVTKYNPVTEETRKKIGEAHKGKTISLDQIEKSKQTRAKNKKWRKPGEWHQSDAAKQKIREANLGKKQSADTIEKRRKKLIGHEVSDETRKKISEAHKGKIISEETRHKLKSIKRTDEQKKHLSEINKGKTLSLETKEKLKVKIVCINRAGEIRKIDKDLFYSQTEPYNQREWVFHKSKEGMTRRK